MIDKSQCQTHTRTPWGSPDHRYNFRLRYFIMGILLTSFVAVIIIGIVFIFTRQDGTLDQFKPEPVPVRDETNSTVHVVFSNG